MEKDKIEQLKDILSIYCDNNAISSFADKIDNCPFSGFVTNRGAEIERYFSNNGLVHPSSFDKSFYYFDKEENRLGNSILHHLGFFYILDPSSAYVTERLESLVPENAIVFDMCAAPGGKSISLKLRREDIDLTANDIAIDRAKEMNRNVERMGLDIKTTSLDPMKLSMKAVFDAIILDAPCSGSGMIRKERKMLDDWSQKKVDKLLPIQEGLLEKAYSLLKPGGILCYATCSLSYEEDDGQVENFLRKHKDILEIEVPVEDSVIRKDHGYHLIPGVFPGEGIYFCFLRKEGESRQDEKDIRTKEKSLVPGYLQYRYKDNSYLTRHVYASLSGLEFLRPGIRVFDTSDHPKCPYDNGFAKIAVGFPRLELTKEEAVAYFSGQEIRFKGEGKDGLCILTFLGMPIGFSKKVKDRLKNYLPKGLRAQVF